MDRSSLFTAAHALTRKTRRAGDDYRATFGLCLKHLVAVEALKARLLALDIVTGVKVWNLANCYVDLTTGQLWGAGKSDWSKQATRYAWEDKLRAAARFRTALSLFAVM